MLVADPNPAVKLSNLAITVVFHIADPELCCAVLCAQECRRGVWFVAATASSVVLAEPTGGDGTDLWHTTLGLMGGGCLAYNLHAANPSSHLCFLLSEAA